MPHPVARKTSSGTGNGCRIVQANTPPSSDPLHGVARIVAAKPVRKICDLVFEPVRRFKTGRVPIPKRGSVIIKTKKIRIMSGITC